MITYVPENRDTGISSWKNGSVFIKKYFKENPAQRAEIHSNDWFVEDGSYTWKKYESLETIKSNPNAFKNRVNVDHSLSDEIKRELNKLADMAEY